MIATVLLTRYNLPSGGVESRIRAAEGWLVDRTALFERYTVPSVRSQLAADRHWLVYLDPQSPAWLKDRMEGLAGEGVLIPVYRESVGPDELRADIGALVDEGVRRLITANLDNDDGLAPDFVSRLNRMPTRGARTALYLTRGLIRTPERLYLRTDRSNAFCAVSEVWSPDAVTCWADWHNRLHLHMPVVREAGEPAWLQVVHQRNVSNRARGRVVSPARYRGAFAVGLADLPEPSRTEIALHMLFTYPARTAFEAIRGAAKNTILAVVGKEGLDRIKNWLQR